MRKERAGVDVGARFRVGVGIGFWVLGNGEFGFGFEVVESGGIGRVKGF